MSNLTPQQISDKVNASDFSSTVTDSDFKRWTLQLLGSMWSALTTGFLSTGVSKVFTSGSVNTSSLNSASGVDVTNYASVGIQISGDWVAGGATLKFEKSDDGGVTYYPLQGVNELNEPMTTTRANGYYTFKAATYNFLKVGVSIAGSGQAILRYGRSTVPV